MSCYCVSTIGVPGIIPGYLDSSVQSVQHVSPGLQLPFTGSGGTSSGPGLIAGLLSSNSGGISSSGLHHINQAQQLQIQVSNIRLYYISYET
jgi:hypothetical protein